MWNSGGGGGVGGGGVGSSCVQPQKHMFYLFCFPFYLKHFKTH